MHSISENSVEKKLNLALESLQQQQEQMKEFATKSSVDELARRVQEECRNARILSLIHILSCKGICPLTIASIAA